MKRTTLSVLAITVLVAVTGCSAAESAAADESSSADDVQGGDAARKADVEDLFHPAPSSLIATYTSTMKGIAKWDVYGSPKGITFRGVSATDKIKVVYVLRQKRKNAETAQITSVGFVRASDFDLPTDIAEAHRLLNANIKSDVDLASSRSSTKSIAPLDFCASTNEINAEISFDLHLVGIFGAFVSSIVTPVCIVGAIETGGLSCLPMAILAVGGSFGLFPVSEHFEKCIELSH